MTDAKRLFQRALAATSAALSLSVPARAIDLKVMTFNIRYASNQTDWNARKAQVIGIIKNNAPDLVGLQEALRMQMNDLEAGLPEYAVLGVGRDDGKTAGEYAAIFYRTSVFTVDTTGNYWLSSTPEVPGSKPADAGSIRINTWARFQHTASGRYLYYNNTHWDNVSASARLLGAQLIAGRIAARAHKEDPVIFTCDCNAGINDAPVRYMQGANGSPLTLASAFERLHPNDPQSATYHNFTGATAGSPIDFIMTADSVAVLQASILHDHVGTQYPSDHFPVMAGLRIGTPVAVRHAGVETGPRPAWERMRGLFRLGRAYFGLDGKRARPDAAER